MSDRILCSMPTEQPGWKAILKRPDSDGYEAKAFGRFGFLMRQRHPAARYDGEQVQVKGGYPAVLVPLNLGGARIDTIPGFLGISPPDESVADAVARIHRERSPS